MKALAILFTFAAAFILADRAGASSVAVGNFSFQTDGTGTPYPSSGSPDPNATTGHGYYEEYVGGLNNNTSILGPDWSLNDTAHVNAGGWNLIEVDPTQTSTTYNNRFLTAGTSDGSLYAFINLGGPNGSTTTTTSITSTSAGLNLTIQPLTTYTLTIAVGNPTSTSGSAGYGETSSGEFIRLLANGNALNSTLFPLASTNVSSTPNGTFTDFTATFTTGATDTAGIFGQALAIQMGVTGTNSAIGIGAFDNVRLDVTAVPEPSTWALLLMAACGPAFLARRRLA